MIPILILIINGLHLILLVYAKLLLLIGTH